MTLIYSRNIMLKKVMKALSQHKNKKKSKYILNTKMR